MYPSNSSSSFNGNDLISYPIQPFCSRPFNIESNPSSKDQEETNCAVPAPPFSFFQFPYSPFEDNEIFLQQPHHDGDDDLHYLHHHQSLAPPHEVASAGAVNVEVSITTATANKVVPTPNKSTTPTTRTKTLDHQQIPMRRRSSKRDRHSKINTARGLRDRRMRLSLDVAKRFFGLQDMLGFDKASKTVEWLLNQAKAEIKQLAREKKNHPSCGSFGGAKSASSTSECEEGVSSLDEVAVSGNNQGQEGERAAPIPTTTIAKRRTNRLSRKSAFNPIGKESREKARERARERTREKKMWNRRLLVVDESTKANKQCNNNNNDDAAIITNHSLSRLGSCSWNPFEAVEESQISVNPSLGVLAHEAEERSSQAKDQHLGCVEDLASRDNSFVIMSRWSPTMILNNPGILQEHQFAEFQSMGKPWEAYNNHI